MQQHLTPYPQRFAEGTERVPERCPAERTAAPVKAPPTAAERCGQVRPGPDGGGGRRGPSRPLPLGSPLPRGPCRYGWARAGAAEHPRSLSCSHRGGGRSPATGSHRPRALPSARPLGAGWAAAVFLALPAAAGGLPCTGTNNFPSGERLGRSTAAALPLPLSSLGAAAGRRSGSHPAPASPRLPA